MAAPRRRLAAAAAAPLAPLLLLAALLALLAQPAVANHVNGASQHWGYYKWTEASNSNWNTTSTRSATLSTNFTRTEFSTNGEFIYVIGNTKDYTGITGWPGGSFQHGFFAVYYRLTGLPKARYAFAAIADSLDTAVDMAIYRPAGGDDVIYVVGTSDNQLNNPFDADELQNSLPSAYSGNPILEDVFIAKFSVSTSGTISLTWQNVIPTESSADAGDAVVVSGNGQSVYVGGHYGTAINTKTDLFVAKIDVSNGAVLYNKTGFTFTDGGAVTGTSAQNEAIDKMVLSPNTGKLYVLARTLGNNLGVTDNDQITGQQYDWFIMALDTASPTLAELWASRPNTAYQSGFDDRVVGVHLDTTSSPEKIVIAGNQEVERKAGNKVVPGRSRTFLARYDAGGTRDYYKTGVSASATCGSGNCDQGVWPSIGLASGYTIKGILATGMSVVGTTAYISGERRRTPSHTAANIHLSPLNHTPHPLQPLSKRMNQPTWTTCSSCPSTLASGRRAPSSPPSGTASPPAFCQRTLVERFKIPTQ